MFPALDFAHPVETKRPGKGKSVLLAHIIATASNSEVVTDKEMGVPADWKTTVGPSEVGHVEGGQTICMHSLAVSPKLQGCGLGKLVINAFVQRMEVRKAERIALICQDVRFCPRLATFALRAQGNLLTIQSSISRPTMSGSDTSTQARATPSLAAVVGTIWC